MGVSEIPSLLNAHSEGLALGEEVDVVGVACDEDAVALVLEDVVGELTAALASTTNAPDGSRPVEGAGAAVQLE